MLLNRIAPWALVAVLCAVPMPPARSQSATAQASSSAAAGAPPALPAGGGGSTGLPTRRRIAAQSNAGTPIQVPLGG